MKKTILAALVAVFGVGGVRASDFDAASANLKERIPALEQTQAGLQAASNVPAPAAPDWSQWSSDPSKLGSYVVPQGQCKTQLNAYEVNTLKDVAQLYMTHVVRNGVVATMPALHGLNGGDWVRFNGVGQFRSATFHTVTQQCLDYEFTVYPDGRVDSQVRVFGGGEPDFYPVCDGYFQSRLTGDLAWMLSPN